MEDQADVNFKSASKGNEAEPMQDEARFVKAALPNL